MKQYLAISPDGLTGIYISEEKQMDEHLNAGDSIYEVEDEKQTLIATHEEGFLTKRPTIIVSQTIRIGDANGKK